MTLPAAVAQWAPRSLEQLLEELADLARRASSGEPVRRPYVTAHLRSGRAIEGVVLALHSDRMGRRTLVLHVPGPERFAALDVSHLPVEALEALTVHAVDQLEAAPPGSPPPPTRLELRRRVAATEKALQAKLGLPLALTVDPGEDPKELAALAHLEALLPEVLSAIASTDLGKQALVGVKSVKLATDEAMGVMLAEGVLTVTAALSPARRASPHALTEAIEKAL